jgi:hypothetical protein
MAVAAAFSLLLSFIASSSSTCVMTQDCTIGPSDPGCRPRSRTGANTSVDSFTPSPYSGPAFLNVCPMYTDVCCSNNQMQSLFANFIGIGVAFGNLQAGGCPACLISVAQWWCKYTCDPDQAAFLNITGPTQAVDPISNNTYEVLGTEVTLDTAAACATFAACNSTGTVKQFPPMQTCEGFFNYQGYTEAIANGRTVIDFHFATINATAPAPAPGSEIATFATASCCNYDPQSCWSAFPNPPGCMNTTTHVNTSCPCAVCAGNCAGGTCSGSGMNPYPGLGDVNNDPLLGFDTSTVGVIYGVVFGLTIVVAFARSHFGSAVDGAESVMPFLSS